MDDTRPSVLFVCVKNGGRSQMAEALMRKEAGDAVEVHSAGTRPGAGLNELSAEVVAEADADMRTGHHPKAIDADLLVAVDRVVVIGENAVVEPVAGMRGVIERWATDEPSHRGIEGVERMRIIREDLAARCRALAAELSRP